MSCLKVWDLCVCVVCSAANSQNNEDGHFQLSGSNSDGRDCKFMEEGENWNIKGCFSSTGCQNPFTGQRWVSQGSCLINPPGMSLFLFCYRRVHMMAAVREWWEPWADKSWWFINLFISPNFRDSLKEFLNVAVIISTHRQLWLNFQGWSPLQRWQKDYFKWHV